MSDMLDRVRAALAERYAVEGEVGHGGMAVVYLARDRKHERQVALKVLRPELAAAIGAERFLAEIKVTAQLNNPHILPLYDSGEAEGLLYYVMPYVEGESLRERLQREKQLPIGEALEIARGVAGGLSYAHSRGLIHRDIKPENVLMSGGEAMVADFGIARAVTEAGGARLTETGMTVGTPAYMSPEQASGERDLDGRSDVYALGCVLYEMLAGEPPLTGPTAQATMARRLTETPPGIRVVRELVPGDVERVVQKALAKVPADRFPTAEQFGEELRAAGDALRVSPPEALPAARAPMPPTEAPPITPGVAASSRLRKSMVALAVVGVLAVLGALAAVLLRSPSGDGLDPDLLAVAPFDVLDPGLELWGEGMVDLLSASLDGAGPLRTVSPSAVVKRWGGRADPLSASRLGTVLGAGLAVYGRLVAAGEDSIRLSATLFDVAEERALADVELRGLQARVDRLADSLALWLLTELSRSRSLGSVRLQSLGSTSPAAVRAFLQGEQQYRRASLDSAKSSFERAISIDSTFALAFNRVGLVLTWLLTGDPDPYFLRAGTLIRGLAPRESLLVTSDSLVAALSEFAGDSAGWSQLRRLFSTLELATQQYTNDAGAWYRLGEARFHQGPYAGVTEQEVLAAFARSVELDSAFAPSYPHLITLTLRIQGVSAGQQAMATFVALNPSSRFAQGIRIANILLDPMRSDSLDVEDLIDPASADLYLAAITTAQVPDSAEVAVWASRMLNERSSPLPPALRRYFLASVLAERGHLREASAINDARSWLGESLFAQLALLGTFTRDSAAAAFDQWLKPASDTATPNPDRRRVNRVHLALPWWAVIGDTASLTRAVRLGDSLGATGTLAWSDTAFARHTTDAARAYLALARRDTVAALRRLAELRVWPWQAGYRQRLTRARLLAATGRDLEAARILEQAVSDVGPLPGEVIWVLERGRVNERLGNREKAIRAYSWVADIWRNADPELQSVVQEARAALERLTQEPRR